MMVRKLYVTEEEWYSAARNYYKHLSGDRVVVPDWMTGKGYEGVVEHFYTTDRFNHEAPPHQRYIVVLTDGQRLDISDIEVITIEEWDHICKEKQQ